MKEAIFVHRETGLPAIPLRFPDGWYLLTLAALAERCHWPRGIRAVRKASNAGELPPIDG